MKIQKFPLLVAITLLFIGFLLGFLTGRNTVGESVIVSVPADMQTLPAPTEETEREICFPIELNSADEEELMALPGIGETMTLRILAYRRERGRFFSVEDLRQIEGMTEKKFEQIRELVYIGGQK